MEHLIISMFHSVRGVPRAKIERLAGVMAEKSQSKSPAGTASRLNRRKKFQFC